MLAGMTADHLLARGHLSLGILRQRQTGIQVKKLFSLFSFRLHEFHGVR
jgi:hypothetical protein